MESLIEKLCDDLEPVKCTRHPLLCSSTWVVVSAIIMGLLIWKIGVRADLADIMHVPEFFFEIILVACIGISATYCAALLRVPDMRGHNWALTVPLTMTGVLALWKGIYIALGHFHMPHLDFHHCMGEGLLIVAAPGLFMFVMAAQGFTTRPVWMSVMNGLAVASVGYLALRFTCASEDLGHALYTHLLPFIVVGTVFGFLARRLYKW